MQTDLSDISTKSAVAICPHNCFDLRSEVFMSKSHGAGALTQRDIHGLGNSMPRISNLDRTAS